MTNKQIFFFASMIAIAPQFSFWWAVILAFLAFMAWLYCVVMGK